MSATPARRSPLRFVAWPFQHIRWKIVLPYAFLTVLLAVVGSYLATQLVTGSLEERFDNQLAEAGRSVSDRVVLKEREHLETVRAVAFTTGVADAIQAGDQESLDSLVRPIAANAAVERVDVTVTPEAQSIVRKARTLPWKFLTANGSRTNANSGEQS